MKKMQTSWAQSKYIGNKINVMWCTKPINACFFGYYALIVLLWEEHSSLAIARELCFPKQHYVSIVASKPGINMLITDIKGRAQVSHNSSGIGSLLSVYLLYNIIFKENASPSPVREDHVVQEYTQGKETRGIFTASRTTDLILGKCILQPSQR